MGQKETEIKRQRAKEGQGGNEGVGGEKASARHNFKRTVRNLFRNKCIFPFQAKVSFLGKLFLCLISVLLSPDAHYRTLFRQLKFLSLDTLPTYFKHRLTVFLRAIPNTCFPIAFELSKVGEESSYSPLGGFPQC